VRKKIYRILKIGVDESNNLTEAVLEARAHRGALSRVGRKEQGAQAWEVFRKLSQDLCTGIIGSVIYYENLVCEARLVQGPCDCRYRLGQSHPFVSRGHHHC
jgi:hypothetical protein